MLLSKASVSFLLLAYSQTVNVKLKLCSNSLILLLLKLLILSLLSHGLALADILLSHGLSLHAPDVVFQGGKHVDGRDFVLDLIT